jgi:hypothetical protein
MLLAAKTVSQALLLLASMTNKNPQLLGLVKSARRWWSGKKIAVIGPTASGKDSFLAQLQGKQIPTVHSNSSMGEAVKAFRVKLTLSSHQAVDIRCKGVINIGGETDYRDALDGWLAVCRDADVVFYMMTITDLREKTFRKGGRVRGDLDWLLTALPHLKKGALIHILINKVDERIDSHTDYPALARELEMELRALRRTVKKTLHPYETKYTGATLISMKSKQIYTVAMNEVLLSVYAAFHETMATRHRKGA